MSTRVVTSCDTCPWGGTYTSRAKADHAYRKHSCERNDAAADRRARVEARRTDPGVRHDCTCPVANHQHGTHAAYVVDLCRCRDCRDALAAYGRRRARQRAYGRPAYVPAQPARTHIRRLQDQGMGWKRVAAAAGLSASTLWKLLYGDPTRGMLPSGRVRAATEAKILAVTLDLAAVACVPGCGTRRRLQALVAVGWSQSELARRLGMKPTNFSGLIHGRQSENVHAGTARAVRDLYDRLWDTAPDPAHAVRALNAASRHGWVPPMAWDDDTIDDPAAAPDVGEKTDRVGGRRFFVEDVEFLLADQPLATAAQLADRLGVTRDAIQYACRRDNRDDLLAQLTRNARLTEGSAA